MPAGQRIALVAAGAGAGIAATFNTPIGGVMFAIELMMPEVSVDTFLPVAIATGAATFVGRWFFGDAAGLPGAAAGADDRRRRARSSLLVLYAVLGARDRRRRGRASSAACTSSRTSSTRSAGRYLRHMLGMLLVGVLMYALFVGFGQYYVDGVGYATIEAILTGQTRRRLAAGAAVRLQGAGDLAQPRLGLVGRHLLAVAVHGRDAGRRLRRAAERRRPARSRSASRPSPWSAWARWSAAAPAR